MIDRLLYRVTAWRPCKIIDGPAGEPYLERYFLFRVPGLATFYLHRFVADDPDRGLHDHPWLRSWAVVLTAGYDEYRLDTMPRGRVTHVPHQDLVRISKRAVRAGTVSRIRGDTFHRVVLRDDRPAWTLFVHGRRVKGWGFMQFEPISDDTPNWHRFICYVPYAINSEPGDDEWWRERPRGRDEPRRRAA